MNKANDANVLLIDNYDSFTYNLVQAFLVLGAHVEVYRNDKITVAEARKLAPTHLVISPGPGRPDDAGVSLEMIAAFETHLPILGVCLGHQSLVQHFGGEIISAARLMHGKTSLVTHDGKRLFEGESVSETMAAVLKDPIDLGALPSHVPVAIVSLLGRCLERDPLLRLRDIGEARIHLDPTAATKVLSGSQPQAMVDETPERKVSWLPWALFAVAAITAAGLGLWPAGAPSNAEDDGVVHADLFEPISRLNGDELYGLTGKTFDLARPNKDGTPGKLRFRNSNNRSIF